MDIRDHGFKVERPEVLDSSMMKDYIDCPSMFYLKHMLGLRPVGTAGQNANLDWGSCWHKVMYVYQKEGKDLTKALHTLDEIFPGYIRPDTDKRGRSRDRMIKGLFDYLEKWEERDKEELEILRHEQFFDIFFDRFGFRWCGRIDSVRRRKKTGVVVVWDYKTSGAMGENYFDEHELGFQFPGYVAAVNEMTGGGVNEITIDVLYVITSKIEPKRKTFRYDEARINEWGRNVGNWVGQIERMMDEHPNDPTQWAQNRNECTRYGRCSFFDIHSISPRGQARMKLLQQNYHVDRWDPSDLEA